MKEPTAAQRKLYELCYTLEDRDVPAPITLFGWMSEPEISLSWLGAKKQLSFKSNQVENSKMSKIDFNSMTLDETKHYFLEHRDDQEAFYAYMDKLHGDGRAIVIDPTDPNSGAQAITAIQQKLSSHPQPE